MYHALEKFADILPLYENSTVTNDFKVGGFHVPQMT